MKFKRRKNRDELLKHPVFISVLLSHMIREYSIPFLRTFSRGTDPFWLASHVRLYNMSRIYRMLFIVFVPCFPMLPLYLYSHLFLCFLFSPCFSKVLRYFLVRPFFSCFPVSPCIPVCFYVLPCIPMFSPACFPIYPPVFLCTLVFLCFAMFSNALPCFPMFSSASPFIPMFSNVFPVF